MHPLPSTTFAREQLEGQVQGIFEHIRTCAAKKTTSLTESIELLRLLRRSIYENLNQVQHRALLLDAADLLVEQYGIDLALFWHPEQTGTAEEPDLRGVDSLGEIVFSAEASAANAPIGSIDTHMKKTLTNLTGMKGEQYYFARTDKMIRRAVTKVSKISGCTIKVIKM